MNLPDESSLTLDGVRYILVKDRNHEVGDGFVLVVDEPNKAQEREFIPSRILKALSFLLKPTT